MTSWYREMALKKRGRGRKEEGPFPWLVGAPSGRPSSLPALQSLRPGQTERPTGPSMPSLTHGSQASTQPGGGETQAKKKGKESDRVDVDHPGPEGCFHGYIEGGTFRC